METSKSKEFEKTLEQKALPLRRGIFQNCDDPNAFET
jgi:hypothetical protein